MSTPDKPPKATPRKGFAMAGMAAVLGLAVIAFSQSNHWSDAPSQTETGFSLQTIQQDIEADYTTIRHIGSADLEDLQGKPDGPVLFDVRETEEFAVSRLADAKQVDPDIANAAFMQRHGASLRGKTVIFYCSVGVRSSQPVSYTHLTLPTTSRV